MTKNVILNEKKHHYHPFNNLKQELNNIFNHCLQGPDYRFPNCKKRIEADHKVPYSSNLSFCDHNEVYILTIHTPTKIQKPSFCMKDGLLKIQVQNVSKATNKISSSSYTIALPPDADCKKISTRARANTLKIFLPKKLLNSL